jgi:hypothetical protein
VRKRGRNGVRTDTAREPMEERAGHNLAKERREARTMEVDRKIQYME